MNIKEKVIVLREKLYFDIIWIVFISLLLLEKYLLREEALF